MIQFTGPTRTGRAIGIRAAERLIVRAERIARRMETGGVTANNVLDGIFPFSLPMGGWKNSGIGARFGGPDTVLKYCRAQAYVSERLSLAGEPTWYPHSATRSTIIGRVVRLVGMHDWRRRLGRRSAHTS